MVEIKGNEDELGGISLVNQVGWFSGVAMGAFWLLGLLLLGRVAMAVEVPLAAVRSRMGPSLMRCIAALALSAEYSVPTKFRPRAVATTAVVPEPRKGSRMVSPLLEVDAMTRWR